MDEAFLTLMPPRNYVVGENWSGLRSLVAIVSVVSTSVWKNPQLNGFAYPNRCLVELNRKFHYQYSGLQSLQCLFLANYSYYHVDNVTDSAIITFSSLEFNVQLVLLV